MGTFWRVLLLSAVLVAEVAAPAFAQPAPTQPAPTTLAAAVAYAAEHNPQVAAARAAARAAEAQVQAVRAGAAPTISLSAGGSVGSSTPSTSGQVAATVSYLVYDGGLRQAQIRQAEAQAESARQASAATVGDVALQTVQAYMAAIVGEQVVRLREQAVQQARTQLAAAEASFRAGRVPRADVIRAESVLAAATFDLVDARGQAETRRLALRTVMGLESTVPLGVAAPGEPPPQEIAEAEAVQRALQRPEVRRSEADVRAAEAALAAAMIQGGITATLDGRYVLVGTGTTGSSTAGTWSVGVGISLPVFDGGRRRAAVEQARANLDAARARLQSVGFQVRQEALLARLQAATAIARVEAARRSALAARESFNVAQGRYAAGVGTILEVATAQTELAVAEVALVQAAADRWTTTAALRRALALSPLP